MHRTLGLAVLSVVVAGGDLWQLSAQSRASALQGAWNTIKLTASVAKGTAAMAPGNFAEGTFTVSGDNLTVTQVRNQAGPIANPVTVHAVRAK